MTSPAPVDPQTAGVEPLDVDGVKVVAAGTIGWLIALVVLLAVDRHSWWVWVCLAGFGLGLLGVPAQARYQRRHR